MSKKSPIFNPNSRKPKYIEHPRPLTHFICIPVDNQAVMKKLLNFQYKVESVDKGRFIREGWYTPQATFHFTL
jgi:hypothetical protein